jgi:hypothetical protein
MKLNGWQRLWVVVAVLWMLPVLVYVFALWPRAGAITKAQVYDRMTQEDGRRLDDYWPVIAAEYGGTSSESRLHVVEPSVNVDGYSLEFSEGTTPEDMKRTTEGFHDGLRQALLRTRLSFTGLALTVWVVPVMMLYALGWGIAWVRRGFHHNKA